MSERTAHLLAASAARRCCSWSASMVGRLRQPPAAQTRRSLHLKIICRRTTRRLTDGSCFMQEWTSTHAGEFVRVVQSTAEVVCGLR